MHLFVRKRNVLPRRLLIGIRQGVFLMQYVRKAAEPQNACLAIVLAGLVALVVSLATLIV
jgi:hypothetical protein